MKTTKKKLAREILIFFSLVLFLVILFAGLNLYSLYNQKQAKSLNQQILTLNNKLDSLNRSQVSNQAQQYDRLLFDLYELHAPHKYSDQRVLKIKEAYFNDYERLVADIYRVYDSTELSQKEIHYILERYGLSESDEDIVNLRREVNDLTVRHEDVLKGQLSLENILGLVLGVGLLMAVVLYPLRGIFILLRWCIHTLREG